MVENGRNDYDNPWKDALREFFPEFMEFFFPDAYDQIDWAKEPVFEQKLIAYEKDKNMPYVTSVERIARKRGIEQGLEQGREEGLEEGMEKGQRQEAMRMLRRLLVHRFGNLPDRIEDRLSSASIEQIEKWAERLMDAENLDDVFEGKG